MPVWFVVVALSGLGMCGALAIAILRHDYRARTAKTIVTDRDAFLSCAFGLLIFIAVAVLVGAILSMPMAYAVAAGVVLYAVFVVVITFIEMA